MSAALIACVFPMLGLQLATKDSEAFREMVLSPTPGSNATLFVRETLAKLDEPKISPLHEWTFDWIAHGYVSLPQDEGAAKPRFRVYSQRRDARDLDGLVTRMLLRLWAYNHSRLGTEHSDSINSRLVDVYLSYGGDKGGQQVFMEDPFTTDVYGKPRKVNAIFIYDLESFTNPLEMAREVAHEYGHAMLPAIAGYKEPEEWATGYLAERLFMSWLWRDMGAGRLAAEDAMGANAAALDKFWHSSILPHLMRIAAQGPNPTRAKRTDMEGMNELIGLALYADALLPPGVLKVALRSMHYRPGSEFASVLADVCADRELLLASVPPELGGKPMWIPLSKGKVQNAKMLKRSGAWALVQPKGNVVRISNPAR